MEFTAPTPETSEGTVSTWAIDRLDKGLDEAKTRRRTIGRHEKRLEGRVRGETEGSGSPTRNWKQPPTLSASPRARMNEPRDLRERSNASVSPPSRHSRRSKRAPRRLKRQLTNRLLKRLGRSPPMRAATAPQHQQEEEREMTPELCSSPPGRSPASHRRVIGRTEHRVSS